jgi:hypothetical protein
MAKLAEIQTGVDTGTSVGLWEVGLRPRDGGDGRHVSVNKGIRFANRARNYAGCPPAIPY